MTRYANSKNKSIEPILQAAAKWKQDCLLDGGSVFQPELPLWTHENMLELANRLPDESTTNRNILGRWKSLLETAPVELKKLAAEVYWVQYLGPHQIPNKESKRNDILEIYSWSGDRLQQDDQHLTDELLHGLGGPLQSFLRYRGEELHWLVSGFVKLLELPRVDREELLSDPDECTRKLTAISGRAKLHSRHMLVFLLFPDKRERSFSSENRRKIAKTFSSVLLPRKVSHQEIDEMPEDKLDELLFTIREGVEKERRISVLDWYDNKDIRAEWDIRAERKQGESKENENLSDNDESTVMLDSEAKNIIYYGPPGTGKTRQLNILREEEYTTKKEQTNEIDYLVSLFESWKLRWWEVVALALGDFESRGEGPKWPREIYDHSYVIAQGKRRSDSSDDFAFRTVVPGQLCTHREGAEGSKYFQPPAIFHSHSVDKDKLENKEDKGKWSLIQNWMEEVPHLAERLEQLQSGVPELVIGNTIRRFEYVTFHQSYSYEDFVEGIRPEQREDGEGMVYLVKHGVFRRICKSAKEDPEGRYAIFIDEINRGNISKIFGELITLLEPDKRAHYDKDGNLLRGMELTLPYSGERFGVPANLNVYGAMNTADQSLVRLDKALRRRFKFKELMPDVNVIRNRGDKGIVKDESGEEIDLGKLLEEMNKRIRFLSSREHMIGHSYFTKVESWADLQQVMQDEVLPLLRDYFYEDWSRIQLVLRDHDGTRSHQHQIVIDKKVTEEQIFGFTYSDDEDKKVYYEVTKEITPESVRKIYEPDKP